MDRQLDCLIVGAGPAGLTAAIYLARFHLAVALVDAGQGRAAMIPRTRNHAGFPDGISGADLLARMGEQAATYGVRAEQAEIAALETHAGGFLARSAGGQEWRARTVLLATGVVNRRPPMADAEHDAALARGLLRYCPICDGYEVTDRVVGVIGTGDHGMAEARFLRMYTRHVTLIAPDGPHQLSEEEQQDLADTGIALADGPCGPLRIDGETIVVPSAAGALSFDSVYPALGSDIRSALAVGLGARANAEGCLVVDAHKRTSISGLYAAGDVTKGLDQISHAMGEAAVAAVAIRNDLAAGRPLLR